MRKLLLILNCLLFVHCGDSEKRIEVNYQNLFSDCLEAKDMRMVKKGVSVFHATLKDIFNIQGDIDIKTYNKLFNGISQMNLPKTFLTNQRAIEYLKELKNTSTFSKIYMTYEEQLRRASSEEEKILVTERTDGTSITEKERADFYTIKVKGSFMNCLIQKSKNQELKEYLKSLQMVPDLAPNVKATLLSEMTISANSTTDKQIIQAHVTFDVFFGLILMFNQF
jgi:hypothetical protein